MLGSAASCEVSPEGAAEGGGGFTGEDLPACTIAGTEHAAGDHNPAAPCQACDPANPSAWTTLPSSCLIEGECYAAGDHDSGLGCTACVPATSQTDWSPATSCSKLILSAVDEESQGDLGGLIAANARCAAEGASRGLPGTWKAVLSSSSQDLRDVVSAEDATKPVVNLDAEVMFPSWNALFTDQTIPHDTSLLRFDGTNNDDLLFTGTKADGTHSGNSCLDWTSTGHWGWFQWVNHYLTAGDTSTTGPHLLLDRGDDPNCTHFGRFGCVLVPPSDDIDRCPDGFPRGTASEAHLVQAFSPALEGVAVCPNGDVFVSQPETANVFRVPLDGSPPELWTTLPGRQPLGMDCAADGALYVADFGSDEATVLRIAAKDDPGTPLPAIPGDDGFHAMNGVATVTGVGIYATDASNTLAGRIILFAETSPNVFEARVVKSGLPFPNDVALNPATGKLDVTMTVNSQVFSYPVEPDGALGSQSVTWSGTVALDAIDGLAVAESNDRYIARYLQGKVSRSSDWQTVASMAEPKSLAFRGGTLLITAKDGLYAVDLAVCGAPR